MGESLRQECEKDHENWDGRRPNIVMAIEFSISSVKGEQPHMVIYCLNRPGFEDHKEKTLPSDQFEQSQRSAL